MVTHPQRDNRLHAIPWLGQAGLAQLRARRIAILGVGNIGGETARHLAMMGIPLLLVDRGVVEPANLGTQGFIEEDIGLPKVEARRRALHRMNPACSIDVLAVDLETMGFAALRSTALWLCCLDSLRLRVRVNEMALRLGIPWIDAAIDGTGRLFARVARYDPLSDAACFLCGYGPDDLRLMQQQQSRPCQVHQNEATPTQAVSAIGAIAAGMQVLWALQQLLDLPIESSGQEFLLNLDNDQSRTVRRAKDPHCLIGHDRWSLTSGLTDTSTLAEAFTLSESLLGGPVTLTLLHRSLVTQLRCKQCSAICDIARMLDRLTPDDLHCFCGESYDIVPTGLLDRMTRGDAATFLDRPLHHLGLPADDVLIARCGDRSCYLLIAPAGERLSDPPRDTHDNEEREGPHGSRV